MFRATGLRKTSAQHTILERIELEVGRDDILAIVGTNGVGKSTLLQCLAGATPLDEGTIRIDGMVSNPSTAAHWRAVFGILDDFGWLPDLTVTDHLMLMSHERNPDHVRHALERFEVSELSDRLPDSLSAGQRQRAILAAAHVRPFRVLLLDEPERHLDAEGVRLLARELPALVQGQDRCAIVVSHSPNLVDLLGCPVLDLARLPDREQR